jgi:hypothetical protein
VSEQFMWAAFAIFVLGIFVGGNLGIILMCLLQTAKRADAQVEELLSVPGDGVQRIRPGEP